MNNNPLTKMLERIGEGLKNISLKKKQKKKKLFLQMENRIYKIS